MIKELKAFLFKGEVLNLAVAVIIAGAFGAIINSLVADIITPLLLNPALKAAQVDKIANLTWNGVAYGAFLSAVINFLVIGTVLFFVVKAAEKAMPKKEDESVDVIVTSPEAMLLEEIRDLLKK